MTKADYFVQAAITDHLRREHPNIPILAEESFAALEVPALARDVDSMLREAGVGDDSKSLLAETITTFESDAFWVLDPIDGTRGFIRGTTTPLPRLGD